MGTIPSELCSMAATLPPPSGKKLRSSSTNIGSPRLASMFFWLCWIKRWESGSELGVTGPRNFPVPLRAGDAYPSLPPCIPFTPDDDDVEEVPVPRSNCLITVTGPSPGSGSRLLRYPVASAAAPEDDEAVPDGAPCKSELGSVYGTYSHLAPCCFKIYSSVRTREKQNSKIEIAFC